MTHNEITPRVAKDIARQSHRAGCDRLLSLLHSRTEKGIQEYGRPLRTNDDHPWLKHLIEELADAFQYSQGALMDMELQGCDRAKLQRAYSSLLEIAFDIEEIRMKRGEGDRPLTAASAEDTAKAIDVLMPRIKAQIPLGFDAWIVIAAPCDNGKALEVVGDIETGDEYLKWMKEGDRL